jgi:hypothetical protein
MKKSLYLALLAGLLISSAAIAQVDKSFYRSSYESRNNGTFNTATSLVSFGYGFPNVAVPGGYGYNVNSFSFGPIYAKYEHGFIRDEVGLGGHVAVSHSTVKYSGYRDNTTAFSLALLGYYHFNKLIPVKNLDVYAGAGLSLWSRGYSYDDDYPGTHADYGATHVYPIIKVGARYYIATQFGFYVETGYDEMSSVNLGVTFRLSH